MVDAPICPSCGEAAQVKNTRYGLRSSCDDCGLWSWDLKPLVSEQVHKARIRAHAAFDPIWKHAENAYFEPPTSNRQRKKLRRTMRNRAYLMLSHLTGLPEPECHMSEQTDLDKLALIERTAAGMTPEMVRDWYKRQIDHPQETEDTWHEA